MSAPLSRPPSAAPAQAAPSWTVEAEAQAAGMRVVLLAQPQSGPIATTHLLPHATISLALTRPARTAQGWLHVPDHAQRPAARAPLGALVFLPPGLALDVESPGEPPRRLLTCHFGAAWPGRLAQPEAVWQPGAWQHAALSACLDLPSPAITALLRRMARETAEPGLAHVTMLTGLGLTLEAELLRTLTLARQPAKAGLAPWQCRRIEERLACPGPAPAIAELAALCGLSPRHLMRAFRQSYGTSVLAHATALRLTQAAQALASTREPIAQIAVHAGFSRPAAFAAAFRRAIGQTPSAFRRAAAAPRG